MVNSAVRYLFWTRKRDGLSEEEVKKRYIKLMNFQKKLRKKNETYKKAN